MGAVRPLSALISMVFRTVFLYQQHLAVYEQQDTKMAHGDYGRN